MKRLFERIEVSLGRLDVIVSNAGIGGDLFGKPVEELTVEEFDRVIDVNLRGAFLCAKFGVPLLKRQGGSMILIASTRALMSEAHTEPYSASKGGLLALAHALAVSLSGSGIRVNAISPGWIATEAWQKSSRRREPVLTEVDHRQHPAG
jgi:NAD(P)-dependent dehydrogenase (short-subunit alcohol dehydrogenase family)